MKGPLNRGGGGAYIKWNGPLIVIQFIEQYSRCTDELEDHQFK